MVSGWAVGEVERGGGRFMFNVKVSEPVEEKSWQGLACGND